MPRKTKDTKTKSKAKAKASAKVVSNIQNKIIIGDVRKPRKKGARKSKPRSAPPAYNIPISSFGPSQPFMSFQTRLLEEQPKVNLLAERVNRLELASLYRPALPPAAERAAPAMLEAPAKSTQGMLEAPESEVNYMDYYTNYFTPMKETPLIRDEKTEPLDTNFLRFPAPEKKARNDLIDNSKVEELKTIPSAFPVKVVEDVKLPSGEVVEKDTGEIFEIPNKEYNRLKKLERKYIAEIEKLENDLQNNPEPDLQRSINKSISTRKSKLKKVVDELYNTKS
jgi:hypothetical protein